MSWALIAVSAIPDQPGAILAGSADIVAILKEDGHADYLCIFPTDDKAGVFLWSGTVVASADDVECDGGWERITSAATIDHYMNVNGATP